MKLSGILTVILITALIVIAHFNVAVALSFWFGIMCGLIAIDTKKVVKKPKWMQKKEY